MGTHNSFSSRTNFTAIINGKPSNVNIKPNLNGKPIDKNENQVYY
nr:MAG TPA: hypothetical protein [Caudoviricetes sp.]